MAPPTPPRRRQTRRRAARTLPQTAASAFLLRLAISAAVSPAVVVVQGELRPESDLATNCFDFPARNFDPRNSVEGVNGYSPYLPTATSDDAIDFTLHDTEGARWNLGEVLGATGLPVVMIWGMFTCPGFQGLGTVAPGDRDSYWEEFSLVETYKDRATFVHLYGPEPHPKYPGTNFDKGITWQAAWSVVSQHRMYGDRLGMADRISGMVHPDEKILPDYFPGNPYSDLVQPVWCSYAMAARAVTVITPDGKIFFQRGWFHAGHVANALDVYLCEQEKELAAADDSGGVESSAGCSLAEDVGSGGGGLSPPVSGVWAGDQSEVVLLPP